ncbi:hypothetical protein [Novispirillum itersonii]|nr:hypothetical protein [Novispirillum itersonii]
METLSCPWVGRGFSFLFIKQGTANLAFKKCILKNKLHKKIAAIVDGGKY